MPGIRDTAYPELKSAPSAKERAEVYTPNFVELVWAEKRTREPSPRVGLLRQIAAKELRQITALARI
jgi:hypothetical protein